MSSLIRVWSESIINHQVHANNLIGRMHSYQLGRAEGTGAVESATQFGDSFEILHLSKSESSNLKPDQMLRVMDGLLEMVVADVHLAAQ